MATGPLTPIAEVGIKARSILFDGPWLRAVYSVGRYRSAWGVHRVTQNINEPSAGDWELWIATGVKSKAAAVEACMAATAKDMGVKS